MKDLSPYTKSIRFVHLSPAHVQVELAFVGQQEVTSIRLIGTPGPGLRGRDVLIESIEARASARFELGDGVLVTAAVQEVRGSLSLKAAWYDEEGEVRVTVPCGNITLERGEPVQPDKDRELKRRESIAKQIRKEVSGWSPNYDASDPPMSVAMLTGEVESKEMPLVEMLNASADYAPVCHQPADFMEVIIATLLAKTLQLGILVDVCEHMKLPHIYNWLTLRMLRQKVSRYRLPPEFTSMYSASEDCPECAIRFAEESEGVYY